jgi:hypothetical protein
MIVRSLLSVSDAPWQTGDLKEIHSRCTKNYFRKMTVVMKNFRSHVEHIFTGVNVVVYQGGTIAMLLLCVILYQSGTIALLPLSVMVYQGGTIALLLLSALHHYGYLKLPLVLMIFYCNSKIRFGYFEAVP